VGRSLPFIILMVAIMPFTKLIVGTKIGVKGAIVPLIVSAAPFIARMVETSLAEVESGVVEAAQSMGASTFQIIWKVYLPEAKPSLVLGGAISIVTILAYTAMAGSVGGGGLGDIAIRYGHQRGIRHVGHGGHPYRAGPNRPILFQLADEKNRQAPAHGSKRRFYSASVPRAFYPHKITAFQNSLSSPVP